MLSRSVITGLAILMALCFFSCVRRTEMNDMTNTKEVTKEAMTDSGIVRLSKIEVYPEYLDEYMSYAVEVGEVSLLNEPGVLTMYAMADKDNPCNITILETYSSKEAYERHIASEHFLKYKQETLRMVKTLVLDDVRPLNPRSVIFNRIARD